jgi:hypothetical protein
MGFIHTKDKRQMLQILRSIPGSQDDKERIALAFGLPEDFYYAFADDEWDKILAPWLYARDEMSREIEKYKAWEDPGILAIISNGKDIGNVPMSRWMKRFLIYRASRKRIIQPYVKTTA